MWLPRRGMTSASKVNLVKAAKTEKKEINIINNRLDRANKLTKSRTLDFRSKIDEFLSPPHTAPSIAMISKSMHTSVYFCKLKSNLAAGGGATRPGTSAERVSEQRAKNAFSLPGNFAKEKAKQNCSCFASTSTFKVIVTRKTPPFT